MSDGKSDTSKELSVSSSIVSVSFHTNAQAWEVLRRLSVPVVQNEDYWHAVFYGLPAPTVSPQKYLSVMVHSHGDDDVHWTLDLQPLPSSEPPSIVNELSELVGGYPAALEHLAEMTSAAFKDSMCNHRAQVTFLLSHEDWKPSLAGHQPPDPTHHHSGLTLTLGKEVWRISGGDGTLQNVSIGYGDNELVVTASGSPTLTLSNSIFDKTERLIWTQIYPLLKAKKDGMDPK